MLQWLSLEGVWGEGSLDNPTPAAAPATLPQ